MAGKRLFRGACGKDGFRMEPYADTTDLALAYRVASYIHWGSDCPGPHYPEVSTDGGKTWKKAK